MSDNVFCTNCGIPMVITSRTTVCDVSSGVPVYRCAQCWREYAGSEPWVTDTEMVAVVFMLVACAVAVVAVDRPLWALPLCALAELVLYLLWRRR